MLAIAIMCILLPLARSSKNSDEQADALDVYKQQLAELDSAVGKNAEETATIEQERAEVSRRILRHSRRSTKLFSGANNSKVSKISASLLALFVLPAIAFSLYMSVGSPTVPDHPLSSQGTIALEGRSINEMVLIAERHLAKNPNDAKGWSVLAGVYGRTNRPNDKARALEQIIRLSGETPELLTDLGEALSVASGNIISARARKLFDKALEQRPNHVKASFYRALALQQEGRDDDALEIWEDLAKKRKGDSRWQQMIAGRLAQLREKLGKPSLPGPTREDVANASKLSGSERLAMIENMVANLADKLKDDPSDVDGWSRLIRSYTVLKKQDHAVAALQSARVAFQGQEAAIQKIETLAKSLGLPTTQSEGENQ